METLITIAVVRTSSNKCIKCRVNSDESVIGSALHVKVNLFNHYFLSRTIVICVSRLNLEFQTLTISVQQLLQEILDAKSASDG